MSWKGRKKLIEELAMVLVKVRALQVGTFTLSSGKLSSYYVDLRAVPSFPGAYRYVIDAYLALIKNGVGLKKFDEIAGIPTAGLAFSSPVALELGKPMIYVRKEEKDYGRKRRIEGSVNPGSRVLVMDDLITTGHSVLGGIEAIREEGAEVKDVVVLIDRLEGGRSNLKKAGVTLHSLTDILELVRTLHERDEIPDDAMKAIRAQVSGRQ
ncbi:MAG: orotate phosphoribosyltransferase [Nitrososphaerota archaeon]|nr:orotate phosphoribosyltransferase [Nitrososphaerota archaeon]